MRRRWTVWGVAALTVAAVAGATWGALGPATAQSEGVGRFAGAMPRGALVYVEARDMAGLLKTWLASPTRARYFESASYRSFRRSRLYLKLQDRLGDLQRGFGVELTDERLAEISGGPTALAIYDPGKLEVVMVTEVPAERALASSLFAKAGEFERRATAKGVPYYAREVVSDGGSLVQRIEGAWVTADIQLVLLEGILKLADLVLGRHDEGSVLDTANVVDSDTGDGCDDDQHQHHFQQRKRTASTAATLARAALSRLALSPLALCQWIPGRRTEWTTH